VTHPSAQDTTRTSCSRRLLQVALLTLLVAASACRNTETPLEPGPDPAGQAPAAAEVSTAPPQGEARPALILSQAVFTRTGKDTRAGPARLSIWREENGRWQRYRLDDPDSDVFHGSHMLGDSLLTLGGSRALLRRWTRRAGRWHHETLWEGHWQGRFNRLRDLELADVDHDGVDEFVLATHDQGVVAVLEQSPPGQEPQVVELDPAPDTFVHEIEVGDLDGDGRLEFFATPSARNRLGRSQAGAVVMYRYRDKQFQRTVVESREDSHAKEILATRLGDEQRATLLSVWEAPLDDSGKPTGPVEIRRHRLMPDGSFRHDTIAQLADRQCRVLLAEDFDGDGRKELIATTMNTGLFLLASEDGEHWRQQRFGGNSGGYEHAATAADLDGDLLPELYVVADREKMLRRYRWNSERRMLEPEDIGPIDGDVLTWHITAARL